MNNISVSLPVPPVLTRVLAVWKRHVIVYFSNLGNSFPPLIEPLIMLIGVGLGIGQYVGDQIDGVPYIVYLIPAMAANIAMWTSSFECTYSAFIRLNYEKVYHPMASTPVNINEIVLGEIFFTGTKGFFFSTLVIIEMALLGYIQSPYSMLIPFVGFLCGLVFGAMGLVFTSYVKSINTLNFYVSGILTPMIFVSGTFFPISKLPESIQPIAYWLPLTPVVDMMRDFSKGEFHMGLFTDFLILLLYFITFTILAIYRMRKKIII